MKVRKFRLIKNLLMPGMLPIILPEGYIVELRRDRYVGEGGWVFATHGVENNKYHWEEINRTYTQSEVDKMIHDAEHATWMAAKMTSIPHFQAYLDSKK